MMVLILVLFIIANIIFMIVNYTMKSYKSAIISSFSAGFCSAILMHYLFNNL